MSAFALCLFAEFNLWQVSLPTPVALAAIAVLGYVVGRRKQFADESQEIQGRREMKRAQAVARELENIAETLRKNIAAHHGTISSFRAKVDALHETEQATAWKDLCKEAEEMLRPTLRLANQVAQAYDEIRQQTNNLMSFTEVRTDPLTGISNRRALDETLVARFAMMNRYDLPFAIMLLDIDNFKTINDERGHLHGDRMLKAVAQLFDDAVRDTDIVARYGGEEFVIVLPQTNLDMACQFADRLRQTVEQTMQLTVSCGVAAASDGDNPQSLLARADAALYSAKAAGRNRAFKHTGAAIESAIDVTPDFEVPAGAVL